MTSKERAKLRSMAQVIDPVVMVGQNGVTDGVITALVEALACHELVKVRFQDFKEDTRVLSEEMALKSESELVATVGFTAVFYKKKDESKKK